MPVAPAEVREEGCAIVDLLLTFLAALAVGLALKRCRVPGGIMVGAIIGAAALSIFTGRAYMSAGAKLCAQCLAGAYIGCTAGGGSREMLARLVRPALILLSSVLALNLLLGTLLYAVSPMDLLTSLMCAVPGGMSDTPIIAADLGADAPKVALLQFVRMASGVGLFPSLIVWMTKNEGRPSASAVPAPAGKSAPPLSSADFPLTLMAAFLWGALGRVLGVPAGTLVFSMLGVMLLKLLTGRAQLPLWAKRVAQVLSGAYIGCGVTRADLAALRELILPAVIILVGYFANSFLTGRLLHRFCGFPMRTAMLAATPAGASDMALISADIGVESEELVALQVIRMVVVVSVFPQLIALLARLFG